MAWEGYVELDGNELMNVTRTETYLAGMSAFRPLYKNKALPLLLDHDPYVDPATDDAPWYEPRNPASAEFLGLYPLEVTGLDDSTVSATAIESVQDGGVMTLPRRTTKTSVFNILLFAGSDAGLDVGKQWLTRALLGVCGTSGRWGGADLRFFASEPYTGLWEGPGACHNLHGEITDDPTDAAEVLGRTARHTQITVGPTELTRKRTSDGFVVANLTFTLTSGDPFLYGPLIPFLEQWEDPDEANPWPAETPPAGASVTSPFPVTDPICPAPVYVAFYDPLCPAITAPPAPPGIAWGCFAPPTVWDRRIAVLPSTLVPGWNVAQPVISFSAVEAEVRNARIRIYPDPAGIGTVTEPCSWVADMVVSFVPLGATLTIDVPEKAVYVTDISGNSRRADSLVFATDGSPFTWPELTCGVQHLICYDTDPTTTPPYVDLALVERFG